MLGIYMCWKLLLTGNSSKLRHTCNCSVSVLLQQVVRVVCRMLYLFTYNYTVIVQGRIECSCVQWFLSTAVPFYIGQRYPAEAPVERQ